MLNEKGYSLAELVVVMAIFVTVTIITTKAFDRLISSGGHTSKSAASQIEGVVGLEMLRRDLNHAGYGLPTLFKFEPTTVFPEVASAPASGVGLNPVVFNEIYPHAISVRTVGASASRPGTDYLVLKSALLPLPTANTSIGRWDYVEYAFTAGVRSSFIRRVNDTSTDLRTGDVKDRTVVLVTSVDDGGNVSKQLLNTVDPAVFSFTIDDTNFVLPAAFQPDDPSKTCVAYGIADRDLKMPYNRADYYVLRPSDTDVNKVPVSCNPGTGILFKAVASHDGGYHAPYPLLNCVGDMKVVYSVIPPAGTPSQASDTPAVLSTLSPDELRTRLKTVKVCILTHEGKKDMNYSYPGNNVVLAPGIFWWTSAQMADKFGSDWRHYRWKVYTISVAPKNL